MTTPSPVGDPSPRTDLPVRPSVHRPVGPAAGLVSGPRRGIGSRLTMQVPVG
ncbi:hypothetical protein ACFOLD_13640 [Kocuria carniphila]|uniref:hypothetical protein n=1 Tax=Kocuria carniphila TaxID=262208 RepID=UPI0036094F04